MDDEGWIVRNGLNPSGLLPGWHAIPVAPAERV